MEHDGLLDLPGPRLYLEIFAALIRDRRVSHGAFRLWHALRDYSNPASKCFPGQRRLASDIGCKIHSLKGWTAELVTAGWLKVEPDRPGKGFDYTVLDGNSQPLRKAATPVAANSNTPRCRNGQYPVAVSGSTAVAKMGNGPLPKVATKVSSLFNQVQLSESDGARLAEIPSWEEFWDYCRSLHCGLTAEWYARDKWEAANADNWKRMSNWRAYARRCKGWWEQDGRPMAPTAGRNGKTQLKPDHTKGF